MSNPKKEKNRINKETTESVHIFAWPFRYNKENFHEKKSKYKWDQTVWKRKFFYIPQKGKIQQENSNELFMINQYLSSSARNIFINKHSDFCKIYEYTLEENTKLFYYIELKNGIKYLLPITSIELHIYSEGMGILFIQIHNTQYTSIEDMKKINAFGRRTMIAFLPDEEDGEISCAEILKIICENNQNGTLNESCANFREKIKDGFHNWGELEHLLHPADFLFDVLIGDLKKKKSEKKRKVLKKVIGLEPIIDDRMFTISLIRDDQLSRDLARPQWHKKMREQLYSLIYIDPKDPTCQDFVMLKQLLDRSLYLRWRDYGTVYGVTAYSMLCLTSTSSNLNAPVVRPFLAEYKYFVSFVLAQWMGINIFADKLGRNIKDKEFVQIQEDYIRFKNGLLILTPTNQEQGIEIYDLLQKQLMIEKQQHILDEQLNSQYEIINVNKANKLQNLAIKIAVIATVVSIVASAFTQDIRSLIINFFTKVGSLYEKFNLS